MSKAILWGITRHGGRKAIRATAMGVDITPEAGEVWRPLAAFDGEDEALAVVDALIKAGLVENRWVARG